MSRNPALASAVQKLTERPWHSRVTLEPHEANALLELWREVNIPAYFTILIPPAAPGFATEWHDPAYEETLTRGNFKDEREAVLWAREHLEGNPYSIRKVD